MALVTQFYLCRTFNYPISGLGFQGGWDNTGQAGSIPFALLSYKAGLVTNGNSAVELVATNPYRVCLNRFVSERLTAQTITGTFNITAGVREETADAELFWRVYLYATVGDTTSVRGVLLDYEESTNEWPTTPTALPLASAQTLTSTAVEAGDRVVLEVGFTARNSVSTGKVGIIWVGACLPPFNDATQATDVVAGETTQATMEARAHYVTFSNAIDVSEEDVLADGDIVIGNGDVLAFAPDETTPKALAFAIGSLGSAVGAEDATGRILVTNENNNAVHVYDRSLRPVTTFSLAGIGTTVGPHALAVLEDGSIIVGNNGDGGGPCLEPSPSSAAAGAIVKLSSTGVFQDSWEVDVDQAGTPSLDVAADQETVFYTSLSRAIKRFDIGSGTQLADFATLPSDGGMARGIKILPDGGVLVADTIDIKRLDGGGAIVQTYTTTGQADWGTIALTSTAATFWSANTGDGTYTPVVVHFDLDTGAVLHTISGEFVPSTSFNSQLCSGGILAVGGFRAAKTPTPPDGPCPGCGTGPGGASPSTGYGGNPEQAPVVTPRIVPEGGEAPSYVPCSTGGDPASASDPGNPQSLTDATSPVVWVQITLPDATVLRYSGQGTTFISGNGATVQPRVTQWSSITQSLADHAGSLQAMRTRIRLADTDRVLRGYLSSQHVDGAEVVIYAETRVNAALGLDPFVVARGVISNWTAVA